MGSNRDRASISPSSMRYRPPARACGRIQMRTLDVISPRRTRSRDFFVNCMFEVYLGRIHGRQHGRPRIILPTPPRPFSCSLLLFVPRSLLYSARRLMLSRMPMLASVQNSDVPPCEISGSGMPLLGTSDSTTLMLKKACSRIVVVMPKATSRAKGSCSGRPRAARARRRRQTAAR